jgi:hypothetical protein
MPTPTDLVTDLPADFEVFGQAVDTQMKTNADAATQKATLTTKGDIYAATGTSTPARLAVGANDTVLTADSTAATGMKWAAVAGAGSSWTEIGTVSPTGTTIATFSSLSGYNSYLILLEGLSPSSTSGSVFQVRFNNDANNYFARGINWNYGSANFSNATNAGSGQIDLGVVGDLAASTMNAYMFVSGANTTGPKVLWFASGGNQSGAQARVSGGRYTGTSTISRIDVLSNVDNFDAGTVRLLGSVI